MVNKATPPASAQLAQGETLLLQQLLEAYPAQIIAALAQMGGGDPTLPTKIATELLSKNFLPKDSKLDRLITLLPSFKNLSPEVIKMVEAGGKGEFSHDSKGFLKESATPLREVGKGAEKGLTTERKGETPQKGDLTKTVPQTGLNGRGGVGFELPMMMNTIKEVLSFLSYFANHADTMKPESLDMIQKVMKPLLDQLVRPVQKQTEGELGSRRQEIQGYNRAETTTAKERQLPLPSDAHNKSDKSLNSHKIESTPKGEAIFNRADRPNEKEAIRSQEQSKSQTQTSATTNANAVEAKSVPIPQERTLPPAAPFSFQHPISTAPRRFKKKPKDSWEEEKDRLADEEDPFSK